MRRAYQLAAKMGTAPKLSNRPNMRGAEFVAPGDHEGFTALPADQTMPGETTMAEREIDLIAMLGAEPAADAGGATSPLEVADQSMDVTLMALREMKELDTCLKSFNVADGLRGRLLVAFKGGYEAPPPIAPAASTPSRPSTPPWPQAGGPVTEACGGDPAQLSVKLPDRTINAL